MKNIFIGVFFLGLSFITKAEERQITTSDGVQLFVKVQGKGMPCLYIHGGPGSGSHWFEKFFGEFMEEHFTVIYLDQRGTGRSGSPENQDYSMKRMAQDFEEVRTALGYEKWLTMGHSFGGLLQMGYAENYPKAQMGMMMINTTLYLNESFCKSWAPKASEFLGEEYLGCKKDTIPLMQRMGKLGNSLRDKDLFWKMAYVHKESQAIMDSTYQDFPEWNYDLGNHIFNFEDYWKNYLPATKNIDIPVLFFYGTEDWMVGPDHYRQVEFPNAVYRGFEGGHIPFQENKKELKKAILDYCEKFNFQV